MRLRNQLLALFCLLLFIGGGIFYFRSWVVQKPFAVILFVTDELTPATLAAARLYEGGADHRLAMELLPQVAILRNSSQDYAVPDAAAAAAALATGVRTSNRQFGGPDAGERSLLQLARQRGRATGLVTNGSLADAGAAAFYATGEAGDPAANALQFLQARIDVALGGGAAFLLPQARQGERADGRDLLQELQEQGHDVVRTKAELENAPNYRERRLAGLFSDHSLPFSTDAEAAARAPALSDMVRRAIQCLQMNRNGYLLVVSAELAGKAAAENKAEHLFEQMLELDRAIATALRYAGERATVVVAGRSAIGGMALNGHPLRQDFGVALLGKNAFGYPSVTWASGPNGPQPETDAADPAAAPQEPAAAFAPQALPVAGDVLCIGTGQGTEKLGGFLENTAVYEIVRDVL